jgi:hypothetical protein
MLSFRQFVSRLYDMPPHTDAARRLDWLVEKRELLAAHPAYVTVVSRRLRASISAGLAGEADVGLLGHFLLLDRDGIHVFRPTVEQVDAAAHTDPTIPAGEFRLAFPATVIQVPDAWGTDLGGWKPLVICTSRDDDRVVIMCHFAERIQVFRFGVSDPALMSDIIDGVDAIRQMDEDLDRLYGWHGDRPALADCQIAPVVSRVVQRIAVTCNLWLSTTRHLNPAQAARLKAKKRDKRHGYAARQALRRLPQEIRLVQEVNVRPLAAPTPEPGDPTGRKNRPHVRRGTGRCRRAGCGGRATGSSGSNPTSPAGWTRPSSPRWSRSTPAARTADVAEPRPTPATNLPVPAGCIPAFLPIPAGARWTPPPVVCDFPRASAGFLSRSHRL